jgi:hypothetical protein
MDQQMYRKPSKGEQIMTKLKHLVSICTLILCSALLASAQSQTPSFSTVNITPEADRVRINSTGDALEMRVEVSDEAGHVVFESGPVSGQQLDWKMTDAQGERVAPGTYLVTVTFRTASGKLRKRVEQVVVAEDEKASAQAANEPTPNAVQAAITGSGTNGKLAKFTGAATIGNSAITESAGKIGIGTAAPTTALHVTSAAANNPAILAGSNAAGGIGVKGSSSNATGIGLWGTHTATTGKTPGVKGETNSTAANADAVLGVVNATNAGLYSAAVHGINKATNGNGVGVFGEQAGSGAAVYGLAPSGIGVGGSSTSSVGVYGSSTSSVGVYGSSVSGYAGLFNGKAKVTDNMEIDGNVGLGTSTPKAKLHVTGGNIFIANPNSLIITAPNGSCWFITVSNTGALSTISTTCP